jgi:hypothetical protein
MNKSYIVITEEKQPAIVEACNKLIEEITESYEKRYEAAINAEMSIPIPLLTKLHWWDFWSHQPEPQWPAKSREEAIDRLCACDRVTGRSKIDHFAFRRNEERELAYELKWAAETTTGPIHLSLEDFNVISKFLKPTDG